MTREEFARLVQERGGLQPGPAVIVDPQIDNPDKKKPSDPDKIPNPNPRRTYIFNNGTQLEARGSGDQTDAEGRPIEIQITDAGTALKPSAGTSLEEGVSAPKDQRFIISRKPDGTLTSNENPNYTGDKDEKSQLQPFGNQLLRVNPDGSTTVIATKAADSKEPTTVAFGDTLYSFDGAKVTALVTKPKEPEKPVVSGPTDIVYQDIPDTNQQQGGRVVNGVFTPIEGLTKDKAAKATNVYGTGPNDEWRITLDDQGNEVSRVKNPNFVAPKPTQMTADTVSQNIPLLKPDGTIQWVPNQNRVPASAAMQDLLAQVGVKVNAGELSMADAKEMLTGTVSVLNAQTAQTNAQTSQQQAATSAATTILENQRQGATTGAGILQNRVSNAQGMLNSVLGLAGQGQRSGNMGGGLMSAPAGLGEALIGGIQGWTTELGGGQGVYDTAARMVTAADPNNGQSPQAQAAYGVLTQMLERYRGVTGQDHPAVAATAAAQASQQNGGMMAPQTAPVAQSQMPNWNLVTGPQNMATTPTLAPGMAGTVAPGDPRYVGTPPQTFAAPVTVPLAPYLTAQPTIPLGGGLS